MSDTRIVREKGWLFLADTLIRAVLHIDPADLPDELWAHQVQMAEWAAAYLNPLKG